MNITTLGVPTKQYTQHLTQEDMRTHVYREMQKLGIKHYLFASYAQRESSTNWNELIINGYPEAWRRRYDEKRYINLDPIVRYSKQQVSPIRWEDISKKHPHNTDSKIVFQEAKDFGLEDGLTIPFHSPNGITSIASIASNSVKEVEDIRLSEVYPVIFTCLIETTEWYESNIGNEKNQHPLTESISTKEREVIAWAASGKTTWETSVIIGISESTVKFHLKNACRKLNASNKANAVYKSLINGVI